MMKRNITNLIAVVIFSIIAVGLAHSAEQSTFSVTKENRIEAHANNLPLNEAVSSLASRFSLEVKGIGLSNEPINLDLSDITLEELLKRLLRGYNYALVRPENADKGILMILGRADRTRYVDAPAPQQAAPPTAATTGTPGVPQGTPAATVARPAQERRLQAGQRTATSPEAVPGAGTGGAGTAAVQAGPGQTGVGQPSAGQTSPGQTASGGDSLVPPMPPAIAGLDMPPMPPPMPAMSSAFGGSSSSQKTGVSAAGPSAAGTVSSGASSSTGSSVSSGTGQSSTQAGSSIPPSTTYQPQGRGSSQTGTTPDLRPPQIPF
jgi:hypothetical protein